MKMIHRDLTHLSRRDALKTLGAGVAALGLGLTTRAAAAAPASPASSAMNKTPQPFTLPKLDYAYDALEPHIDARTMEIHHTKHHQAYINNSNAVLKDDPALRSLTAEDLLTKLDTVPEKVRRTTLRNNVGGHVNHTFFWEIIGPARGGGPVGELASALEKTFGSFDSFRAAFEKAAAGRFGSGWAWLVAKEGKLTVTSTANQDSPLMEGAQPVLGIDVWEHAYYLKYQNRRAEYVSAFWNVVQWEIANAHYRAALKA